MRLTPRMYRKLYKKAKANRENTRDNAAAEARLAIEKHVGGS